ncbi:siphovirus Gp157 family protein [Achromobacter anxifer]
MNMPLYVLSQEYRALAVHLAEGDFDEKAIADTIEASGLPEQIGEKAQGCEMVARTFEADIPAIDTEIKRLQELKRARQARADALRDYLLRNMIAGDIQVIDCPLFRISIVKNPPAVEVFDEKQIPADYFTSQPAPPPKLDKTLIAQALKDNHDVPGARLRQGLRLAIR